jgi:hypothetical protein
LPPALPLLFAALAQARALLVLLTESIEIAKN